MRHFADVTGRYLGGWDDFEPPNALEVPFAPDDARQVWHGSGWSPIIFSSEELRAERDRLLAESDWTQVADAPVNQAAWASYRQALRDVPQQAGFPDDVVWPTKPG